MSFAHSVKKEVNVTEYSLDEVKAFLHGYILLKGEITIANKQVSLIFRSTSLQITKTVIQALKQAYGIDIGISKVTKSKLNKQSQYIITITDEARDVLSDLHLSDDGYFLNDYVSKEFDENSAKVITGMFLAKGSINDPSKLYYHLEIVAPTTEIASYLVDRLDELGISAHIISRTKGEVVYIKRSEDIGDFLKLIGTNQELFNFENERIKKDYNNYINRIINCDMANGVRSQETISRQLEAIKEIEDTIGFATLSTRLMEGVILRTKYPTYSLQELSEVSEETVGRYIPKSTLCHIMQDLEKLVNN